MVVPYIGTWIETSVQRFKTSGDNVVPYIGTWIETPGYKKQFNLVVSYLI